MATFTPPTHTEYMAPPGRDRLWSRVPYQRGNAVLITGTEVTPYPGAQVVDGDAVIAADYAFLGGGIYELDEVAELILAAAGYLTSETSEFEVWPAWL